jgi:hypothetical protein
MMTTKQCVIYDAVLFARFYVLQTEITEKASVMIYEVLVEPYDIFVWLDGLVACATGELVVHDILLWHHAVMLFDEPLIVMLAVELAVLDKTFCTQNTLANRTFQAGQMPLKCRCYIQIVQIVNGLCAMPTFMHFMW